MEQVLNEEAGAETAPAAVMPDGRCRRYAESVQKGASTFRGAGLSGQLRDYGEFARLAFGWLELVPPGVTLVSEWRQDEGTWSSRTSIMSLSPAVPGSKR